MITIAKFIIGMITVLTLDAIDMFESVDTHYKRIDIYASNDSLDDPKSDAVQVLDNKCNVCHIRRNKRRVFSSDNMDTWVDDIYKQVFVKKRMPKGKKNKLTSQEYQIVLTWISSTKNPSNEVK